MVCHRSHCAHIARSSKGPVLTWPNKVKVKDSAWIPPVWMRLMRLNVLRSFQRSETRLKKYFPLIGLYAKHAKKISAQVKIWNGAPVSFRLRDRGLAYFFPSSLRLSWSISVYSVIRNRSQYHIILSWLTLAVLPVTHPKVLRSPTLIRNSVSSSPNLCRLAVDTRQLLYALFIQISSGQQKRYRKQTFHSSLEYVNHAKYDYRNMLPFIRT